MTCDCGLKEKCAFHGPEGGPIQASGKAPWKQWEYKIQDIDSSCGGVLLPQQLAQEGIDGWELVTITYNSFAIFKRPVN